ncbi:sensor histidine kinase [Croceivirga sp. JEA036]|uniref:sensor histidine kinase n=1 Tax=Croceivirga sp. JEA036 TaxID=2721162 RepID=UPI00143B03A7|nr:sensor histidine kinase [Croceivirga sp. JEA036]NJB35608.1 response regulator [Croceivirga sp. JEA036]
MKTKELLNYIAKIENGLDQFSYEELNSDEAKALKASFASFKNGFETKVFGEEIVVETQHVALQEPAEHKKDLRVVANVSHEIRTPLNSIIGFLDLLKETGLDTRQLDLVRAMDVASNSLLNLINELLEYSKIASGNERIEQVSFNPKNLVSELSFLGKTLIAQNDKVSFNLIYDENIPEKVIGDPAKLSQVLLNLLGNAIKFVERGSIDLVVNLKETRSKRVYVEFLVKDTGIGIASDQIEYIFESYRQATTYNHNGYQGCGLGLSIVKELVSAMNGCIAVSSVLGKGTTFEIIMPFEKVMEQEDTIVDKEETKNPMGIAGTNILVVEDDFLSQKLMETRLNKWKCNSFFAQNSTECFAQLKQNKVDIILMDNRLPGESGLTIAQKLKENPSFKNIPILLLSADILKSYNEEIKEYGIADFILKPCKSEILLEKIKTHIIQNTPNHKNLTQKEEKDTLDYSKVDLNALLHECMGKTEIMEDLIFMLKNNVVEFIGKMKVHMTESNFEGLKFVAHKIKSSLKMVDAKDLLAVVKAMEDQLANQKDLSVLRQLHQEFITEYQKTEPVIDRELNRLKNEEE